MVLVVEIQMTLKVGFPAVGSWFNVKHSFIHLCNLHSVRVSNQAKYFKKFLKN